MLNALVMFDNEYYPVLFHANDYNTLSRLTTMDNVVWVQIVQEDGGSAYAAANGVVKQTLPVNDRPMKAITPDALREAIYYIKKSQKIRAIKEIRDATNWGLKDSKDFVDTLIEYVTEDNLNPW
jgi:ribosomal protein L7/L12